MAFGFGRQSCPGRYFAATEIKLFFIHFLTKYDIKMPDGVEDLYQNSDLGGFNLPYPTKTIMFRKRA